MEPRVIVVTSGKGGVGKTTTSASIASGLAMKGYKTCVIDFDVGLRNLDLALGCERRVVFDLINVINKEATLPQALIKCKHCPNLHILPASQTRDKDHLTEAGVQRIIETLKMAGYQFIVCDSPAGIERGAVMALHFADDAIVVTNPEISSIRDSERIIGMIDSKARKVIEGLGEVRKFLLITRYDADRAEEGEMLAYKDVADILRLPVIGVIPEERKVLTASNQGQPVIYQTESNAAQAYWDSIERYLGEQKPLRFVTPEPKGILSKFFGGKRA